MASTLIHALDLQHGALGSAGTVDQYWAHNEAATWTGPPGTMEYQTAVKQYGNGAYHFLGGNQASGDFDLLVANTAALVSNEMWLPCSYRFHALHTSTFKAWLHVGVPFSGAVGSDLKPIAKFDKNGKFWIEDSNGTNGVASSLTFSLDTWYTLVLHVLYGASALQELLIYDGDPASGQFGKLLDTVQSTWDTTGTFNQKTHKIGGGTIGDWTGADFYVSGHSIHHGNVNPGPCQVRGKLAASTLSAGSWTAFLGTLASDISEIPIDDDTSYDQTSTLNDVLTLTPNALSLPAGAIPGVVGHIRAKYTGSSVTMTHGVQVAAAQATASNALSTGYAMKAAAFLTNPNTGTAWDTTTVDTLALYYKNGPANRNIHVTAGWVDVVFAPTYTPPVTGPGAGSMPYMAAIL